MTNDLDSILPKKAWFTLKEICAFKGLNYKTATNKPHLQPASFEDVGGRKMFRRKTVLAWLDLSDKDIAEETAVGCEQT